MTFGNEVLTMVNQVPDKLDFFVKSEEVHLPSSSFLKNITIAIGSIKFTMAYSIVYILKSQSGTMRHL